MSDQNSNISNAGITYICDRNGEKTAAVVPIGRYNQLLEYERMVARFSQELKEASFSDQISAVAEETNSGETDRAADNHGTAQRKEQAGERQDENREADAQERKQAGSEKPKRSGKPSSINAKSQVIASGDNAASAEEKTQSPNDRQSQPKDVGSDTGAGRTSRRKTTDRGSESGSDDANAGSKDDSAGQTASAPADHDKNAARRQRGGKAGKKGSAHEDKNVQGSNEQSGQLEPHDSMTSATKASIQAKNAGNDSGNLDGSLSDAHQTGSAGKSRNAENQLQTGNGEISGDELRKTRKEENESSADDDAPKQSRSAPANVSFSANTPKQEDQNKESTLAKQRRYATRAKVKTIRIEDTDYISLRFFTRDYATGKYNYDARGYICEKNGKIYFVVTKGSLANLSEANSLRDKVKGERQKLIDRKLVKEYNGYYRFTEDVYYNSSSMAASVVAGSNRSGYEAWKASDGVMLKIMGIV